MPTPPLPSKRQVCEKILSEGRLTVHLDARRAGVVMHPDHATKPHLALDLGLNLPVPIADLVIDDRGWRATLSFNRRPCWCDVPWSAVFALSTTDGNTVVWHADVPTDIETQAPTQASKAAPARAAVAKPSEPKPRPAWLRVVK